MMKRRDFLKQSSLASSALLTPAFLQAINCIPTQTSRAGKILIVLQLSGGNDGLNTIIPHGNDIYYQQRPSLAIPAQEVIKLNDQQGLHPALTALRSIYDNGQMTILNSVGYPNPDRSHFRSMDIWQTGSSAEEAWSTGWIGRYLDNACLDCAPYHALEVNDGLSLAMKGQQRSGFAMSDARRIRQAVNNPYLEHLSEVPVPQEDNVAFLYKTLTETTDAADYLYQKSRLHRSNVTYPNGAFARDLKQIAELITADTDTKVYYASMGGFDTHANQKSQHQRLLTQYAEAVAALVKDLQQNDLFEDVLIMTFSEFGRRLNQNASGGTDHGTANNLFLMGGSLNRPGFYNEAPNLSALDNQDLIYNLDFRRVYATLIERWLEADAKAVLRGEFAPLNLI